jgi:hypothetical protein
MARGDERRSKNRQDVGASSSGPSTKPKKLAKRPWHSSYQEESSPEVSPPRGGTPNETECLKMHSLEIHTTQRGSLECGASPQQGLLQLGQGAGH